MPTPVAILLSGRGSNFLALAAAVRSGDVPAEIVLVLANEPGALGLEKARQLGLEAVCVPHLTESSRANHESKVVAALAGAGAEWVCLAGYMRLLSSTFVRAFPERILNIHPSLLPAFPGLHAQRQALDYGVTVSGCTVHLVDEELDHGPIVVQRAVPVEPDDTPETLSARILGEEHLAYPLALRRLLTESWSIEGRRVRF